MITGLRIAAALCFFLPTFASAALSVWSINTRYNPESQTYAKLPVLADVPDEVKAILVDGGINNLKSVYRQEGQSLVYQEPSLPYARIRTQLLSSSIALITPGAPDDQTGGISTRFRDSGDHLEDISILVKELRKRYPTAPIYLGAYAGSTPLVLNAAQDRMKLVDGYIVMGGYFRTARNASLEKIKAPGVIFFGQGNFCTSSSYLEAQETATRSNWQLVSGNYASVDKRFACNSTLNHALAKLEDAYAPLLVRWMMDPATRLPASIGVEKPAIAYTESVHMIKGGSFTLFGRNDLEMTLLTPPGDGPFPIVVYSHGDVDYDSPERRNGVRYRDLELAREFLGLGFAVAQTARSGIGKSSGDYPSFQLGLTGLDAMQKGEEHAKEIFATVKYVQTLPQIDGSRIILSGQSAGGFASTIAGAQWPTPEWLKGVVNFSGGRTNMTSQFAASYNQPMIDAFGLAGAKSKVPQLWIFAENDSRYTAETIKASHKAFVEAGGNAELRLFPPSKGDGHFVYHEPEKWRGDLRRFLTRLGFTTTPETAAR